MLCINGCLKRAEDNVRSPEITCIYESLLHMGAGD